MEIRRCMKCMRELKPGETVCPECGQSYGDWKTEPFALKPGTILDGKYLVGEMLGQGGFGITYIGFDLLLEQKVAIKEYFPMSTGIVSRDNQTSVVWSSTMMEKSGVQKGFDSFLKEARKMARLRGISSVVGVNSVFIQNETAYIVMDFIEGETLLKKLGREGPMTFDTCVSLLRPIIQALLEVHKHGIIHRDISPDNIMVQKNGKLILLDLGAAKDLDIQTANGTVQSSQLVAKQGFSPFEQYGRNGKIGPWTDVYAMAATIYYCCTGILPPSAIDRIEEDTLSCQPLLTEGQFRALSSCMEIMSQKRPQSMEEMLGIITTAAETPKAESAKSEVPKGEQRTPDALKQEQPKPEPVKPEPLTPKLRKSEKKPNQNPPKPKTERPKWLIPAVVVGLIVLVAGFVTGFKITAALNTPVYVMAAAEDLSAGENEFFWGMEYKREDVEAITFQSTLQGAPNIAWDVSEAKDHSILAWMDGKNLYVAADGKIAPNNNASNMFAYFENLREIDFGNCFDTSNVTNMSSMFERCSSLTSLDVSGFNTANVTDMSGMFIWCSSLTSLDVSGFTTSNVTDMSGMFFSCASLTSLDVSSFNTSNVTIMSFMFFGCTGLTSLDVSSFNTSNVTNMKYMFYGCSSLTNLDVSGFDTSKVTDMSDMFRRCDSLTDFKCTDSKILAEYNER